MVISNNLELIVKSITSELIYSKREKRDSKSHTLRKGHP